jgi:PAS domain S-box-containing protein
LTHVLERDIYTDFDATEYASKALTMEIDPDVMHAGSVGRYEAQLTRLLKIRVKAIPSAEALRLFDAKGDLLYSSKGSESRFNILDRPYFQKLKDTPTLNGIYSESISSRATGHASLVRAEAIRDAKGTFVGLISIAINLSFLHQHFVNIDIGSSGVIALRRLDNGTVVVRLPGPVVVNHTYPTNLTIHQAIRKGQTVGSMTFTSPIDGVNRLHAYRQIDHLPFYIVVGIAESDYLASWRKESVLSGLAGILFLAILARVFYQLAQSDRRNIDQLARVLGSEQGLRQAQAKLQRLYQMSPLGIALTDMTGHFVDVNPAFETICGYTAQELKALDYWKLTPEKYMADEAKQLAQLQLTGRFGPYVKEYIRKDGGLIPLRFNGLTVSDGDGQSFIWSIVEDITESRRSEEQVKQAEALLRTSFETIDEAFVIYDADDRLVFCNDKYRQVYAGVAHLMLPGVSFETLIRAGAQRGDYLEAVGRVDEWVTERMAAHRESNRQLIQRHSDGRVLKIIERKTPDGHTIGFRVDVTELHRAIEAAETANTAKSRFLATMSHEIRTPMNGVLGMAQLLTMPDITEAERIDYAGIVVSSGNVLMALINDILDLSKIEADKIQLERIALEPAPIMAQVRALFAPNASAKGIQIGFDWQGPLLTSYLGDPHRITQMLSNLVGNALKFTSQGSIRIEGREIESDGQNPVLEFSVTDTGIGIPEDKLNLLFQTFSQVSDSTSRDYGGTGLGLSIVRKLAELMGGEVGVESKVGQGSRFWFRIWVERVQ